MPNSIRPGDKLAGRYRLVDLLAESGGARFWRARDTVLERYVAVHVIDEDDARAAALMAAARRSAGVLDRRILRVLDAAQERGVCYVVNEWGEGISLDILVSAIGTMGPRRSAWLVAEVADSIAAAHDVGVAHGRLVPENVLVDGHGELKIIGLCVDAAMHGLAGDRAATDVADLAGLLYCSLTGRWAGPSASAVPGAPRQHGEVLRPRRVRAGIPGPLDQVCDQVLHAHHNLRRAIGLSSARGISEALYEFVGDTTGMADALRRTVPPPRELEQVVLPHVPDPMVVDLPGETVDDAGVVTGPGDASRAGSRDARSAHSSTTEADEAEVEELAQQASRRETGGERQRQTPDRSQTRTPADIPTEAGLPIFNEDGEVDWLRKRSTPPPPPPPFEPPPERPLFAPEPARSVVPDATEVEGRAVRWPWVSAAPGPGGRNRADRGVAPQWDTGPHTGELPIVGLDDDTSVPGRSWLRLGVALGLGLFLLVAALVAFNMGRGLTPLGDEPEAEAPEPTSTLNTAPLTGLQASDLDPQDSDTEEKPEEAPLAVDGDPATSWSTWTYEQQLGPNGLKNGLGLVVDLGAPRPVARVEITFVGAPTDVSLFLKADRPSRSAVPAGQPIATESAESETLAVDVDPAQPGRYLVVWLTNLPETDDGYRGEIAEVAVEAVQSE